MLINLSGLARSNPLRRSPPWNFKSPFLVVNTAILILWLVRIASPAAWVGAMFSYQANDGRYYSLARPMEIYLIIVFVFGFFAALFPTETLPILSSAVYGTLLVVFSAILILEIVQHHLYLMIIRPHIDPTYKQYNGLRTIILTFMALIDVVNFFAAIYYYGLRDHFNMQINHWSAWAFSAGEITGASYAGITPRDTRMLAMTNGTQKLIGILFLAMIISLALGRIQTPDLKSVPENR